MQVQVAVCVHVRETQSGLGKSFELSFYLVEKLLPCPGA